MTYFITKLSFNFLVKEFLKLVNIFGEVTNKMVDRVISPIRLTLLSSKMQNSSDEYNN